LRGRIGGLRFCGRVVRLGRRFRQGRQVLLDQLADPLAAVQVLLLQLLRG